MKTESGSDNYSFLHTNTAIRAERLCQLPIYIAKISATYIDGANVTKNIPGKSYYFREAHTDFYRENCKTTEVPFSRSSETKLTNPMDSDHYEVKDMEKYIPQTVFERAVQQIDQYITENKTNYPDLAPTHTRIHYTSLSCSQELPTHQSFIKEHFEYLHGINLSEMGKLTKICLLYTSPSPRDLSTSRMPSSA